MSGNDEFSRRFHKTGWNWITPDKYPRRKVKLPRAGRARKRHEQVRTRARRVIGFASVGVVLAVALFFASRSLISSQSVAGRAGGAAGGATGGLTSSTDQATNLRLSGGQPANGQTVDGMQCYPQEATQMHIHVNLEIVVDGKQGQIPPGLGFVAPRSSGIPALGYSGSTRCIYPVHVHYPDNQVHVESPFARRYTLGEVFDLWGEPLSKTQALGYQADAAHALAFGFSFSSSAGPFDPYLGDPRAMPLLDNETIKIVYQALPAQG
ncbi:MAG TPA: hypothetical protein VE338_02230 [Ktedonobacterales bacterium]|jgi:hypothetical protein|nr:hypothetical protein [Ktedonobacterales bacterium]